MASKTLQNCNKAPLCLLQALQFKLYFFFLQIQFVSQLNVKVAPKGDWPICGTNRKSGKCSIYFKCGSARGFCPLNISRFYCCETALKCGGVESDFLRFIHRDAADFNRHPSVTIQDPSQGADILHFKSLKILFLKLQFPICCTLKWQTNSVQKLVRFSPSLYFANIYLASKEKGKMFDLTERATQFGSTTASLLSGSTSKAGSRACLIVLLDSTCSSAICFSYAIVFFCVCGVEQVIYFLCLLSKGEDEVNGWILNAIPLFFFAKCVRQRLRGGETKFKKIGHLGSVLQRCPTFFAPWPGLMRQYFYGPA